MVVAGSENGLANDQVVWQFHPDDDVGAVGFDVVLHEEGRWNAAADPFMDRPLFPAGELRSRCVSSRCHAAPRLPDSVGGIVSRGAAETLPWTERTVRWWSSLRRRARVASTRTRTLVVGVELDAAASPPDPDHVAVYGNLDDATAIGHLGTP